MEMSGLSWLALLTFYMLYVLLGGCMFNAIECRERLKDKVGKNESVDWDYLSRQSSQSTLYYRVSRLKSDNSIVNGVSRSDLSRLT